MANGYDIDFPSETLIEGFLADVIPAAPAAIQTQVRRLRASRFVADTVGGWHLPETVPGGHPATATGYAALQWWRKRYLRPGKAAVDFVMLNRLAELLVRARPTPAKALRLTYPFVFGCDRWWCHRNAYDRRDNGDPGAPAAAPRPAPHGGHLPAPDCLHSGDLVKGARASAGVAYNAA
jgi:hypothetical protein